MYVLAPNLYFPNYQWYDVYFVSYITIFNPDCSIQDISRYIQVLGSQFECRGGGIYLLYILYVLAPNSYFPNFQWYSAYFVSYTTIFNPECSIQDISRYIQVLGSQFELRGGGLPIIYSVCASSKFIFFKLSVTSRLFCFLHYHFHYHFQKCFKNSEHLALASPNTEWSAQSSACHITFG